MPDWSLKRIWHIYVFILHCYCAVSAMSLWDYMVRKHKSRLVLWLFRIYFFFFFFFFLFSNCFINRWLLRPSVCAITNQPNLLLAQNVMFWLENFSFRSLFHIYKLNYEQFAISYFCMQFNLAELWMHTLKRKEGKIRFNAWSSGDINSSSTEHSYLNDKNLTAQLQPVFKATRFINSSFVKVAASLYCNWVLIFWRKLTISRSILYLNILFTN